MKRRIITSLVACIALLLMVAGCGSNDGDSAQIESVAVDGTDGQTLIAGAKRALIDVVERLPDEQRVGLRAYDHRYPKALVDDKWIERSTRAAAPLLVARWTL